MKKFLLLATLLMLISGCGVQRPYPPIIELITPNPGLAYTQQGYQGVIAYSLHNVRISWNITDIGAHGVKIIAAHSDDYDCNEEIIATRTLYITDSSQISETTASAQHLENLAQIFYNDLEKFIRGDYAICISAIKYDHVSAPSIPVFLTLLRDQQPFYF